MKNRDKQVENGNDGNYPFFRRKLKRGANLPGQQYA